MSRGRSDREFMVALGQRLRAARGGLSQAQVAATVGLSRTSWINVEQGRQNITVATLVRMATALNVPVESLIPGSLTPFTDVAKPLPPAPNSLRARVEELERRLDGSTPEHPRPDGSYGWPDPAEHGRYYKARHATSSRDFR